MGESIHVYLCGGDVCMYTRSIRQTRPSPDLYIDILQTQRDTAGALKEYYCLNIYLPHILILIITFLLVWRGGILR